ncbi:hypothetical protein [Mucilaginibacter lacusdianchii]|uniref:hypothetical protein n=1 Tax=Mucilaginibacter lacusdianchii TaxID=2684211 RepID=UPI00131D8566|nr:hypothetical protein [Mucilaginibacter sp. JXJ CY 39]
MDEFYQRKLFLKKKYIFKENGIDIEFTDSDGNFSLFIPFDNIDTRNSIRIFSRTKKSILRIGFGLTLLTLFKGIISIGTDQRAFFAALATAAVIAIIFYSYYHFTYLKYYAIPLKTGKHFQVLYNTPSKREVDDFIEEIYTKRKNYLRTEYFFIDYENISKDELKKMHWLFNEDVINRSELEVAIAEINDNNSQ